MLHKVAWVCEQNILLQSNLPPLTLTSQQRSLDFELLDSSYVQHPGKGGNIVSLKNCQIQFVWDGYLLHAFWELWSFATKNVGFKRRFFSY